jgi:drug/metabolite transporter (DMT)-like permease
MSWSLLLAIVFAASLFILFRYFKQFGIDSFQAIVVNYLTAALAAFFLHLPVNWTYRAAVSDVWMPSLFIGLLFITVFYLTSVTTRQIGLTVATVAARMSVVMPVMVGVILYQEQPGPVKFAGMGLALAAVFFISTSAWSSQEKSRSQRQPLWLLPVALFLGSGLVDSAIKYMQAEFMNEQNRYLIMTLLFVSAATIGMAKLLVDKLTGTVSFGRKNVMAGILLGVCNYFSLYFLVQSLEAPGAQSAVIFSLLNIGVVLLASLYALVVFREKVSGRRLTGMLLALAAMLLMID